MKGRYSKRFFEFDHDVLPTNIFLLGEQHDEVHNNLMTKVLTAKT